MTSGYAVVAKKGDGSGPTVAANPGIAYSTQEVATADKWINGKTIYRKTINFGALPNATTKNVAHGISNLSQIIKYEGFGYTISTPTICWPFPRVDTVIGNQMRIVSDATNITVTTTVDWSPAAVYATIYYTKTT